MTKELRKIKPSMRPQYFYNWVKSMMDRGYTKTSAINHFVAKFEITPATGWKYCRKIKINN